MIADATSPPTFDSIVSGEGHLESGDRGRLLQEHGHASKCSTAILQRVSVKFCCAVLSVAAVLIVSLAIYSANEDAVGSPVGSSGGNSSGSSGGSSGGSSTSLEAFSSADVRVWSLQADPVMGGRSSGTFTVESGFGVFEGEVRDVPKLGAPGFLKAEASGTFPDISGCNAISLVARTSTPDYGGWFLSFGTQRAPESMRYAFGFKAPFTVPPTPADGSFSIVTVPLHSFSDYWDAATGKAVKTCAEDARYCPDEATLRDLGKLDIWAEGAKGKVHLEIESIAAVGCAPELPVFIGNGCFWHTQYDTVRIEQDPLGPFGGRSDLEVTSRVGYAGGTIASPDGRVCYHGGPSGTMYETLGHAEACLVLLDEASAAAQFGALLEYYFTEGFKEGGIRLDPQDAGPPYRNSIGLPGGVGGELYGVIEAMNINGLELVEGRGGPGSDLLDERVVYIYDSNAFPFNEAEEYHQFHPNRVTHRAVPASYTGALKNTLAKAGKLNSPCDD